LLWHHEKLIPFEAVVQGFLEKRDVVATHIGAVGVEGFLSQEKASEFVVKPFFGFAGHGVKLVDRNQLLKELQKDENKDALIQPFLSEIHDRGDCRVIFVNGEALGHFTRYAPKGEFISNLAQGGRPEKLTLNEKEKQVIEKLGRFLKASGIVFAGLDMIGARVSEVNITSPTGLVNLIDIGGRDCSEDLLDFVES
jgi:glutathione synthase